MTKLYSFAKCERLTSKKKIDTLFLKGEAFFIYPFKIVYHIGDKQNQKDCLKVVISIPKRNFKRANKRNHLRRLIKESYRLHKNNLKQELFEQSKSLNLMIVYSIKEELNYNDLLPKVIKTLEILKGKISTI